MYVSNEDFDVKDGHFRMVGRVGRHGEIESGTLWHKDRPIVSTSADMHKIQEFDGLLLFNVQDELKQITGLYYHGDIWPLSRKTLADNFIRMAHLATQKSRGQRQNIFMLKRYTGSDSIVRISDGEVDLCKVIHSNMILHSSLTSSTTGKNSNYLQTQFTIINAVLARPKVGIIKYSKKLRLVSKHETFEPIHQPA